MRNLIAAGLVGIAVSAGGCATEYRTTAGLIRLDPSVNVPPTRGLVWSCPSDRGPDPNKNYPNCDGAPLPLSPAQAEAERAARQKHEQDMMAARAEGEHAGARSCPQAKVLSNEKRVDFTTDSSELSPAAKDTLKEVADNAKTDPKVTEIRITGTTDNTGSKQLNDSLSEARATAVKQYLEQEGVPESKIQTHALGESAPVASNETPDGRALNRSAQVIVIAHK
jgi:outer membrane protein OmpA-like peptidoglycan-associated protein